MYLLTCHKCFKQVLEDDAEFCPHCGNQFIENKPKLESAEPAVTTQTQARPPEQILWRKDVYKGVINKQLVRSFIVSSLRCYIQDGETNKIDGSLRVDNCDVTVMNSRRLSSSTGGGSYVSVGGLGSYGGSRRAVSRTFGDLYFTHGGKLYFIFPRVNDPSGVKKLIDTLKKEFLKGEPR